ncbi:MAG: hypothetical protein ACNS64_03155 [Candidatus Halalkalibacterium sp. M3_1C_030]
MIKSIKHTALAVLLLPLLFMGCNDLFDKGDVEKAYDGPDVVAFADLQSTVNEGSSLTVEIQFISSQGLANSDISVSLSADGAPASTYSLSTNSVTIASGSASAEMTIDFPSNTDISSGDEVTLTVTLSSSDVEASENLDTKTIFIRGVD